MILAEEKLNEISKHVSTAFNDETISDEEFALVVSQLNDFFAKERNS